MGGATGIEFLNKIFYITDGIMLAQIREIAGVDGTTLQKISSWEETDYAVGCITVFCGEVRLIDNIKYKEL